MTRSAVWVALSGGVDSAVAASIELENGAAVVGVSLLLRDAGRGEIEAAAAVAAGLGIEHRVLDARLEFQRRVVEPFVSAYGAGITPNPCVVCNQYVKFGLLLDYALEHGADALATGHYARIVSAPDGVRLARAADGGKDQSYFLYRLGSDVLASVRFPLGDLTKREVRAHASRLGMSVAERPESQDVCFLDGCSAAGFVSGELCEARREGPIEDLDGREIGRHAGVWNFTVGQRKGLPGGEGPRFVVAIDAVRDAIIVGPRSACETRSLIATDAVWRGPDETRASVCVRARTSPVDAYVVRSAEGLVIETDVPVCAAPGQSAVCYDGDVVLGGGTIAKGRSR